MREREPRRMKERPIEMRDGANVPGNTTMNAAVQRISDDWMADAAQMDTYLMGTAGVNRNPHQRQHTAEVLGADDASHRLAASPYTRGRRRHLLPVRRIAADRRVDAPTGHHLAPGQRGVFLFDLAVGELARELLVRRVVLRDHHQSRG